MSTAVARHDNALMRGYTFWREFLRAPRQLGACSPSSPALRRAQVEGVGLEQASYVAELGSGTGTTTRDILHRMRPGARFFGVELNSGLASGFRRRLPGVSLIEGDAMQLRRFCDEQGIDELDVVVTSLPWMLFPPEYQLALLTEIHRCLRPGGRFTMLTYRYPGLPGVLGGGVNRYRGFMQSLFRESGVHRYVPWNLPPASVYLAVK